MQSHAMAHKAVVVFCNHGQDITVILTLNNIRQSEVHLDLEQQESCTAKCKSDDDSSFEQFFEDIDNGNYARGEIVDYFESSVIDETQPNKCNNKEIRIFVTSLETLKQVELYVLPSESIQLIMNRARAGMDELVPKQEDRLLVKESDGFYKIMNKAYPISAYNILADSVLVIAALNTLHIIDATMAEAQVKNIVFVSGDEGMNNISKACVDSMA
ncbi:hypothetical protein DdX_13805 [Ditylenchus destructor]|uniref:Uncharacterized protein n=1 Tax=Ditylenchus destructor TaxID=166010 RepID=A0AAD4MY95_9BILA|nr:hypothetical protein DdX_13805 [Ditylenchus destructor]